MTQPQSQFSQIKTLESEHPQAQSLRWPIILIIIYFLIAFVMFLIMMMMGFSEGPWRESPVFLIHRVARNIFTLLTVVSFIVILEKHRSLKLTKLLLIGASVSLFLYCGTIMIMHSRGWFF